MTELHFTSLGDCLDLRIKAGLVEARKETRKPENPPSEFDKISQTQEPITRCVILPY